MHDQSAGAPFSRVLSDASPLLQMDGNARIHGIEEVQQMIEAKGASSLSLPAYGPDLSPIEPGWAKVKISIKRLRPETWEHLSEAITIGIELVEASDVAGWFDTCGHFNRRE